ncbi:MAG TPA: Ig-like domain-containing protein [Verrucomicrobiae bacterium]|nr:Ig-like domain-containing protein [Verrucomicrobiae bacterium]
MQRWLVCWGFAALAGWLAGCSTAPVPGEKLAAVAALPSPSLPPWIASISPVGANAQSLAQIRVIFNQPVAGVESLEGSGSQAVLAHVAIAPRLAGRFVLLTPRMIGFVADQALPVGTRVRVTLSRGLRDLNGDTLGGDLAWTFETAPLALSAIPQVSASPDESTPPPVALRPTITLAANAKLDEASLAEHLAFAGGGTRIAATVKLEVPPTPYPGSNAQQLFDPSLDDWVYDVTPANELQRGTTYAIVVSPGVEPAYGNVPTSKTFAGGIRTYGAFALVSPQPTPGGPGRFQDGDPSFTFTNPIDAKSIAGAVTVSPQPASVKHLAILSDDATISIDPYALDPDTTYTVAFAPTLKDTFGQTLGSAQTMTLRTGDFAAGAWAAQGTNTIAAGANVDLNFYATNVPGNVYRSAFASVAPKLLLTGVDPLAVLPDPKSWGAHGIPNARRNQQSVVRVPLQAQLGAPYGALAYGFETPLDDPTNPPSNVGIAQLTNLGVFAQYFPGAADVMVQHLSDGAPAPGVALAFYRIVQSGDTTGAQPCASGATGSAGTFELTGAQLESCYAGATAGSAPAVGVIATQGADTATLVTQSYSGVYRYNVMGGWTGGAPLSRGTVFPDRDLYQPGERGEITGVAYYALDGVVKADRNATYAVTLTDPNNHATSLGNVTTDAYGVFSLPIAFAQNQPLGYYTIDAKGANGNDIGGSLRVAEFKPPNFKLDVALDATSAVAGASVGGTATAAYLFGAPLEGGVAHVAVTRTMAAVAPKGWDDFSFGPQWFYPDQPPSYDSDVSQSDDTLDAAGKTSFQVGVAKDLPFPMTYDVDVRTTDVSNLEVADNKSFLALASDAVIGLDSDVVGAAATPMPIRVIVTDANGNPVAGRAVHLLLQKMTYTSASQAVEGGESADQAIEYDTVATADTTSAQKPVTVDLTPPDSGSYRVRANFGDSTNVATATDIQVFACGAGAADWGASDLTRTPVELDKKAYKVGDTATAMVASPFARADIYVSVVRNGIIYQRVLRNASGSQQVRFPITAAMLPNAAFQAVVVRRGPNLGSVKPGSISSLSATGMAGFDVSVADRYLTLGVAPQNPKTVPGGSQRVELTLHTKAGAPVRGEVVVMVVNDAILQLTGYRPPDLVATVFADQPISTIFSDSRDGIVLSTQTPPVEKGYGFGGGYLAGAGSTRVRTNFRPLAYYGRAQTDASGKGSLAFALPDDLTTWRVMAVAIASDDAHFATADATFISTQPLITNPLLPQFARTGDVFDAGVSVSNQTGASGALGLVLELSGALAFRNGAAHALSANEQAATGMQAFRFPVVAGTPAPSTFAATSTLGTQRDAFRVPFLVSNEAVTESVIDSGVASKSASVPIALDRGGWLQLTLANSIVPQFAVPADRAMTEDPLPLADVYASRLVIASALAKLAKPYRLALDFDPVAVRDASLRQLRSFQRDDGGFAAFAGATESDPFESAYALDALAFARSQGASVGDLSALGRFASQTLANPGRFAWCAKSERCKAVVRFEMLWGLAQIGERRTDFLGQIVASTDAFSQAGQIHLARYLLQTPGWQGQGAKLADHLEQTLYVTGRYAAANVNSRWGWFFTPVDAQAQMLQLLLERHAPPELVDGAVRQLVAQQCRCGWPSVGDSASALQALAAYAATEHLAPGSVTASAGGRTIATATFGATASSQRFTIAASSLRGNAIDLAASGSTVHYSVLYTYDVPAGAPGALSAFRVVRTVAAPGPSASPLATMDLPAASPVSVSAGNVYDVGVRVIVDHPVERLVIEDPLPAGFEAVDASFRTTSTARVAQSDSWEIDSQQIYRDKVVAFAQSLGPGIYEVHYLVRSVTPGVFAWPGARAYLQDAPEQFGRSAATTLTVK